MEKVFPCRRQLVGLVNFYRFYDFLSSDYKRLGLFRKFLDATRKFAKSKFFHVVEYESVFVYICGIYCGSYFGEDLDVEYVMGIIFVWCYNYSKTFFEMCYIGMLCQIVPVL